jgi:hypothetical protein
VTCIGLTQRSNTTRSASWHSPIKAELERVGH